MGRVGTAQGDWVGLLVGKLLQKKTREALAGRRGGTKNAEVTRMGLWSHQQT